MHELSVTQGILTVAAETARQHRGGRIQAINLVIGDLSSIVDDSVQFYFDILSQDTLAAGAELHFRRESATTTCGDCGHQFQVSPPLPSLCPICQSVRLQVSGGREFYVESIEVEDEDTGRKTDPERQRQDCGRESRGF